VRIGCILLIMALPASHTRAGDNHDRLLLQAHEVLLVAHGTVALEKRIYRAYELLDEAAAAGGKRWDAFFDRSRPSGTEQIARCCLELGSAAYRTERCEDARSHGHKAFPRARSTRLKSLLSTTIRTQAAKERILESSLANCVNDYASGWAPDIPAITCGGKHRQVHRPVGPYVSHGPRHRYRPDPGA